MASVAKKASCCVIGAGVSGLTTAIELLNRDLQVTVLADAAGAGTTSSAAAAFWYPFWVGNEPDHSWYRPIWAWDTFLALEQFTEIFDSGVSRVRLIEYFDSEISHDRLRSIVEGMWWRAMPGLRFEEFSQHDVSHITCLNRSFQSGIAFETLVVNMSFYLPFLFDSLSRLGGHHEVRHVTTGDLEGLCKEFDFVVNCAGLGARELVCDDTIVPNQGIVVQMSPLSVIKNILLAHTGPVFNQRPLYIVPRGGPDPDIILGGTLNEGVEGTPKKLHWKQIEGEPWAFQEDVFTVLQHCRSLEPRLLGAETIGVSVGYRPSRKPARVEPEFERTGLIGRLFHNYGHGGGGVTLSWGCAREVVKWVEWFNQSESNP